MQLDAILLFKASFFHPILQRPLFSQRHTQNRAKQIKVCIFSIPIYQFLEKSFTIKDHPLLQWFCTTTKNQFEYLISKHLKGRLGLELWNRILKSLIKVGCPSRFKSFLSDFLRGRKPLLLWSF